MKKLYLSDTNRIIGGVFGGIGEYFDKNPTIFRILFILLTLLLFVLGTAGYLIYGLAIVVYLAMWLILPKKPKVD
ncbi:MAG: PspC domain-containing protein [Candidatus Omnitrophica bacterium]|nr:PspC domain-containing protein [Candidatus Omnitrophota bacterium]